MKRINGLLVLGMIGAAAPLGAQTFATEDPVLRGIWREGTENSQLERLGQALLDSIGPRLTASPLHLAANEWLVSTYQGWGITARNEQYGSWRRWRRGHSRVELVQPRVRSLEATLLAWSHGTQGPITADATILPTLDSREAFETWLPSVRGNFVAISFPQPTCRPDDNWMRWSTPAAFERMQRDRAEAEQRWNASLTATGLDAASLQRRIEAAGAVGILTSAWPNGWGVTRIFNGRTERIPVLDLSCEDYGLVARLAQNGQGPQLRVDVEAEWLGEVPAFNTVAEIRGRERPNEYVMLSAHFDSWDAASGATDNGTGTLVMMEAMRILRAVYPNPRRTILVGHWGGEEQGLNGSRGFVADNPRVIEGLQALFNQDNGTGRVVSISMQGFTGAAAHFGRWLSAIPTEITRYIQLEAPGIPSTGGSDHAAFVCAGAPAFSLSGLSWDYGPYTWHTNRDTYDKIVFDDVRNNALLTAMLVYLASEDPQRVSRDRRTIFPDGASSSSWPTCQQPSRRWEESGRVR